MTPSKIREARHALGLSAERFAAAVGVASGRTVRRWERGDRPIPGSVALLVARLLVEIDVAAILSPVQSPEI